MLNGTRIFFQSTLYADYSLAGLHLTLFQLHSQQYKSIQTDHIVMAVPWNSMQHLTYQQLESIHDISRAQVLNWTM